MAEEINKTYTSNSLYNDSTGVIAFAEQLKQELINWANYQHVTEELGQNRPDLQSELNNLFLSVYERFLTFLNDADASEEAINTWKEIENFLADYTDDKTLASIVAELNNKIESRLTVPLESTTGSSITSTMTQKAITETIDASKTFTTGEKVDNVGIDDEPTAGSDNLVKSGGVQNELALGAVYDVSAKNPTAGTNNDGKWESLSALFSDANLNTLIPTSVRKGGMSIKFVQSSNNQYVQYILKAQSFSTNKDDWDNINLESEVESNTGNLQFLNVEINGIEGSSIELNDSNLINGLINSNGIFLNISSGANSRCWIIPISQYIGGTLKIVAGNGANHYFRINVLREYVENGQPILPAFGFPAYYITDSYTKEYKLPFNTKYLYIYKQDITTQYDYTPASTSILSDSGIFQQVSNATRDIKVAKSNLSEITEYKKQISTLTLLGNCYLNASSKVINSFANASVRYYPVKKDVTYKVSSDLVWDASYDAVGFMVNTPTIGGTYDLTIINSASSSGQINFTPSSDGYVLLVTRYSYSSYIYAPIPKEVSPLFGRNVAILGDSIMQYMGGTVPSDTITLKNYNDPSDTNIYQTSQATIVGGLLYLTSSLVDGQVVASSIRLEVVNSSQETIDTNGWDYIKQKLGAANIINCAMGGGTYCEMGVVTEYPSVNNDELLSDKLRGFPNQVRMLKRLVSKGIYSAPDVIVIWMGVNGTTTFMTDTLTEAMSIPWDTLKDDYLGYEYRRKFFGALRFGIESLYRAFPNALIMFFSPVMTNRGDLSINSDTPAYRGYTDLKTVSNKLKEIAERYSCMFFDALCQIGVANFALHADTLNGSNQIATGTNLGNIIPQYIDQYGIHPNDAGKVLWGNYLCRMLSSFYFDKA